MYIYYLLWFKRDQAKVQALLNFNNNVNAMSPVYIARLSLKIQPTDIRAKKIDGSIFEMFGMVITSF